MPASLRFRDKIAEGLSHFAALTVAFQLRGRHAASRLSTTTVITPLRFAPRWLPARECGHRKIMSSSSLTGITRTLDLMEQFAGDS